MDYTKELTDPNIYPDETVIEGILGNGFEPYLQLCELFKTNAIAYEWKYYRDGKMWLCKATKKNKTIVWMSAVKGFMRATIYVPEKAIDGIYRQNIAAETKDRIKNTKNTGKSKGCTFELRDKKVLEDFNILMQYKMSLK